MEPSRPLRTTATFSRRVAIETPEHVVLELELAGLGSRVSAALIDQVMILLLLFLSAWATLLILSPLMGASADGASGIVVAVLVFVWFSITWGYYTLFEGLAAGRTPGKRRMGIRVVMESGHPITFTAAAARNLLRLVDFQPANSYVLGLLMLFFHKHHRRLGDLVAGTLVVRDRPEDVALAPADIATGPAVVDAGVPVLTEQEFRLLKQYLSRLDRLPAETRRNFGAQLASRFEGRVTRTQANSEAFLVELYDGELTKRQAKSATRRGASGTVASGTAIRFVALRQPTWEAFRTRAAAFEHKNITELGGADLTDFAAQYRAVAADLARARTYGVDRRVLRYLERVVAMGHNAVYGFQGIRRPPIDRLLLAEFPAAVWRARRLVTAAAMLFVVAGSLGFTIVRQQPDLIYEIMPDGMIQRAEIGAREVAAGRGYAETPSPYLPLMASAIITNNIQVAFAAFAFGVTAGIGTVFVLVFNGLFFGAVLAMFANYELAGWLLTFVAAHGVLELTAIFIASAAGLLLGKAILMPGDLARRDALATHGREAIKLVGAAATLLLLAGIIEGLLSASGAPAAFKFGVSAASVVLAVLYFAAGRRHGQSPILPE